MWYSILFFMGLLMVVIGLFLLSDRIRFIRKGTVTTAKVIKLEEEKDSDGERNYKPFFQFTTQAQQEVVVKYRYSSPKSVWKVGKKVRIVYDNRVPEKVVVLTYAGAFGYILILAIAGLILMIVGGGYFLAEDFFRGL